MTQRTFRDTVLTLVKEYVEDNIRLSCPAVVVGVQDYQSEQCVDVRPIINSKSRDNYIIKRSVIYKVPLVLLEGGGALFSVPIALGDVVKLEFSKDSIEEYLVSGKKEDITPNDLRRYALTDAIATPCFPNYANNLSPNPDDLEIKFSNCSIRITPDGDIFIDSANDITITAANNINVTATAEVNVNAETANITATTTTVNGDAVVTGECTIGGIPFSTHTHGGVTPGGGTTSVPQ